MGGVICAVRTLLNFYRSGTCDGRIWRHRNDDHHWNYDSSKEIKPENSGGKGKGEEEARKMCRVPSPVQVNPLFRVTCVPAKY